MGKVEIIPPGKPPVLTTLRRCSGCGRCVAACPEKLYTLDTVNHRKQAVSREPERCSSCGGCIVSCPLDLISSQSVMP